MFELLVIVAALAQVPAQNVRPQIGYVYPPGAQAGQTVDVRIGTYDWTPDMQIFAHDARVKIEITGPLGEAILTPPPYWFGQKAGQLQPPLPREVPARITIPADMPSGPIRWQAANANGGSNVGTFVVGDKAASADPGYTESVEPEKHAGTLDLARLPVTVSGRISKIAEIDTYRFTVPDAGLVVCRLDDRLGQPFHGLLSVRDATGKLVTDSADTAGRGALAMFVAQAGSVYDISVHDVEFAGDRGYVYRLSIRRGPHVVNSLPLVVRRGATQPIEIMGWGVATGALKFESLAASVTIPESAPDGPFGYAFNTPAGRGLVTLSVRAQGDTLELESTELAARQLKAPAAISGALDRIDPASGMAAERFQISAEKGDVLSLLVEAARFGSPVDPSLAVVSSEGKEIVRSDDLPGSSDAAVDFIAPADGTYDVIVSDVSGVAPSRASVYRLSVENAAELADFTLQIPDRLDVPLGGKTDMLVKVTRRGQWNEPIVLRFEHPAEGIVDPAEMTIPGDKTDPKAPPAKVKKPKTIIPPGKSSDLKVSLAAPEDAAAGASLRTLIATTTVGDRTIERRSNTVLVSSTLKTRCTVKSAVQDGGRLVNRGTTYPADVIIERLEGYTGPVTLQMAATQQRQRRGIESGTLIVPAGVDRVQYPIVMPEWLETSLTARMILIGVAQVPDPKGNVRHVTGVMDGFIVMSLEGALLKLSHEPQERVVQVGGTIDIPVRVARSSRLPETVRVEIVPGDELPGCQAEPITLPVSQSTAVVKLRVADDPRLAGSKNLTIRATALQDGKWPAVSETIVPLVIEAGGAVARAK